MDKLLLIEQTNALKLRLGKLFFKVGYKDVETFQEGPVSFSNFLKKNGVYKAIVIDYDQIDKVFEQRMEEIRLQYKENMPKIVVLTGQSSLTVIKNLYAKGVDDIVVKPFTDETVMEKLNLYQNSKISSRPDLLKETIKGGSTTLSWSSDIEIGVAEIDQEHKKIVEHFQKLYSLMKEGKGLEYFAELLVFLEYYVDEHFEHEEKLQLDCGYPQLEEHKAIHNDFKAQVKELIVYYKDKEVKNLDLIKLNLIIKEWLVHHILIEDKKIKDFLN